MPDDSHVQSNANNLERHFLHHTDGTKEWYQNGKLHRDDGPALEWPDGNKSWYVNGTLCLTIEYWAAKALQYENKSSTQEDVDAKVQQVMQQDLFE